MNETPFQRAIRESTARYIGVPTPAPREIVLPPSLEGLRHGAKVALFRPDGWDSEKEARLAQGHRAHELTENDRLAIKRMASDNLEGPRPYSGFVFQISLRITLMAARYLARLRRAEAMN